MSDDQMVTIEVDGRELQAKAGSLLIEVTDAAGVDIPRFCYHKKLSVAANCRMCLVEVEKVPKPLPACATPVTDGMKVHTRSPLALAAQKGTMEFLLINHPLDCPICDQGGECELQDLSLGYGSDVSRYVEGKRVVPERDIGPLISTCFTRCIHCTRCIRFGAEIAGIRELGAVGRGEHMQIGTYVEKSVDSELSGNIIDVCPVGALTSKPFQYRARAWELVQHDGVSPHDAAGSNLHIHVRRGRVMRVHPKENEAINECWISDRDRFSYEGLYSADRLTRPLVRSNGEWQETDWEQALEQAALRLQQARGSSGDRLAALISPSSTLEEMYLAQRLMRGLESDNIDVRLRQGDFRGTGPAVAWLGQPVEELEGVGAALLVGANIRKEQPILGHRLRKAAMNGARIHCLNPLELDLNYPAGQLVVGPAAMAGELAAIARALGASGPLIDDATAGPAHEEVAEALRQAQRATVLLGAMACAHPDYSMLRGLAAAVAEASGAVLGFLPQGANATGAALLGIDQGEDALSLLRNPRKGYLLLGAEPGRDFWNPALANAALEKAECVVALTSWRSPCLEQVADVMLPVAAFAETSGTYVNAGGSWQSFGGAATPPGEARPAWKVLRVLGNLLDLDGFDQESSGEVLAQARAQIGERRPDNAGCTFDDTSSTLAQAALVRIGEVPLYGVDPLVRRAAPLQKTRDALGAAIRISPALAGRLGLGEGDSARLAQDGASITLPVILEAGVPDDCVRLPAGVDGTEMLGGQFGEVTLEKA
ncbi:MAG TPA: NADH-quinone oxidoreductase subunit G [Sedimenticola thiotaurini]|uniref:NADH-quinone oxidoreductase n=1 Tax=Sedimenticola thiotaurini TaxID=1543721 RepID=A0A831W2W6_9GAMM|nr:NADH-quinone oxidoreductase subunit G [Sedimenticola thiotaurini]